jgi:hypothetical protein
MAQLMLLIGLLLLAFLLRRAFHAVQAGWRNPANQGRAEHEAQDRPLPDPSVDMARLEKRRGDLEARVAVLERLLVDDQPTALPPPVPTSGPVPPAG